MPWLGLLWVQKGLDWITLFWLRIICKTQALNLFHLIHLLYKKKLPDIFGLVGFPLKLNIWLTYFEDKFGNWG